MNPSPRSQLRRWGAPLLACALVVALAGADASPTTAPAVLTTTASTKTPLGISIRGAAWLDSTATNPRLIVVGSDGSIRQVEAANTTISQDLLEIVSITRRPSDVRSILLPDPKKQRFVTGEYSGEVRTWDLPIVVTVKSGASGSGRLARNNKHDRASVAYGKQVLLATNAGAGIGSPPTALPPASSLLLEDVTTLTQRRGHVAAADAKGHIDLWDSTPAAPTARGTIEVTSTVTALAFGDTPDPFLYSGDDKGHVSRWSLPSTAIELALPFPIAALDINGPQAATFDKGTETIQWVATAASTRPSFRAPMGGVAVMAVPPQGGKIAVASDEAMAAIQVFKLDGTLPSVATKFNAKAKNLAMNGTRVFVALTNGEVKLKDSDPTSSLTKLDIDLPGAASAVGVDDDTTHVLIGCSNGAILESKEVSGKFDTAKSIFPATGNPITALCPLPPPAKADPTAPFLAFSDGNSVSIGSKTKVIQKFTLSTSVRELAVFKKVPLTIAARLDTKVLFLSVSAVSSRSVGPDVNVTSLASVQTAGGDTLNVAGLGNGTVSILAEGKPPVILDDLVDSPTKPVTAVVATEQQVIAAAGALVGVWTGTGGAFTLKAIYDPQLPPGKSITSLDTLGSSMVVGVDDGSAVHFLTGDEVDPDDPPKLTLKADSASSKLGGVALAKDGTVIAAREDGDVYSWPKINRAAELTPQKAGVSRIVVGDNGELFSASLDGTVFRGKGDGVPRTRFYPRVLVGSPPPLRSLDTTLFGSGSDRIFALGGDEKTIHLIDKDGNSLFAPPTVSHLERVTALSFNKGGTKLASGSSDATVKVWTVGGTASAPTLSATPDFVVTPSSAIPPILPSGVVAAVTYHPTDPDRLAAAAGNRLVILKPSTTLVSHSVDLAGTTPQELFTDLAWSPDGSFIAATTTKGQVLVYAVP